MSRSILDDVDFVGYDGDGEEQKPEPVVCLCDTCEYKDKCDSREEFFGFEQYLHCTDLEKVDYQEDEFFLYPEKTPEEMAQLMKDELLS